MPDTLFVTARFPEGIVPRTSNRATMRRRVHRFIPPGVLARMREAGGSWGTWRREREAVERILERTDRVGVGPKLIVQRRSDMEQLSIRELEIEPDYPDLGCNPYTEEVHYALREEFGKGALRSGGRYLCRFVDGTRSVSRHGYIGPTWQGSAEDEFVTSGGMPMLLGVADWLWRTAKAGRLNVATVIVQTTIRTAPDFAPRPYGGAPHFHLHHDEPGGRPCSL